MAGSLLCLSFIFNFSRLLRMFSIVLILISVQEASSRCGCNRAFEQGAHAGVNNDVPVAGDIYKTSTTGSQSSSINEPEYKHVMPNYKILQYTPTYLDFRDQPIGVAALRRVTLTNPSHENSLSLLSISGDVEPFYSRFHIKVIPPLSNTTLELVFLARVLGNVEKSLYIHTNKGAFPYQVFGTGIPNQYKLRSFFGARIPLGGSFTPYVNMYNPYSEMIRLVEMFSSGGFLHLELPSLTTDSAQKLWEIPSYETKPVIKASFKGKTVGNHTGFIRIKAKPPVPKEQNIILPFHIQVCSEPGLYTNIDLFDFGTLRTMDEPKSLNLHLVNYGNKPIHVLSVAVEPPNSAVTISFTPTTLKGSPKYTKVASVSYSALHTTNKRQHRGKIVVTYGAKGNKKLEIGYQVQVLQGTLAYSVGKAAFYAPSAVNTPVLQPLTVTNTFSFPLIIHNASLPKEVSNIFSISNFTRPITVQPQKLLSPLAVRYQANSTNLSLSTTLRLYTNASIFTIPIHSYTGKLKYDVEGVEDRVLDYGTIGVGENRSLYFKIVNNNPVEVSIREYSCSVNAEFVRLRLVDVKRNRKTKAARRSKWVQNKNNAQNKSSNTNEIMLRPSDVANFVLDVTGPPLEGSYNGEVRIKTAYEEVKIPVYLKTVIGSIISRPRRITFEQSFPGQSKNFVLHLESSFSNPIQVTELKLHPPDSRFLFSWPSDGIPTLYPNTKTKIGWIQFNPMLGSDMQCYLCLCKNDQDCLAWMNSLVLPTDTWEFDLRLLEKIKKKWEALKENQETRINSSIIVNSEIIKGYSIPLQASLSWPSVVEQSIYFPPTHTGNYSLQKLILNNPADVPVLVQILPLMDYPHPPGGLDLVSDRLEIDSFSIELSGHDAFFLPDLQRQHRSDSRKLLESKFGVFPAPNTINLLLKRRSKETVTIGFRPDNEIMKTSIVVVRNNLTVLDLVVVQGKGARGQFTINNKKPGLGSLLLFEMKENHLADCHKSTPKARTYPSFTVKRTFSINNPGQLPIHVTNFKINGHECSGFGFRVLNCEPFVLSPNTSRKLDVTFTPDFTSSRVSRLLQVFTTMEPMLEFTLLATLPHNLLPICASALPSPSWEPYLHITAAVTMTLVFILVIFMAYLDAQKYVIHCSFGSSRNSSIRIGRVTDIYTPRTIFDLNAGKKGRNDKEVMANGTQNFHKDDHQNNQNKRGVEIAEISTPSRSRSSSSSSIATDTQCKVTPASHHSPLVKRDSNKKENSDNDTPNTHAKRPKKKNPKQNLVDTEEKSKVQTDKKQKGSLDRQKDWRLLKTSVDLDGEMEQKGLDDTDKQTNSGPSGNDSPSEEERIAPKDTRMKRNKKKLKRQGGREDKDNVAASLSSTVSSKDSEEETEKKPVSFTVVETKYSRNQLKKNGNRNDTTPSPSLPDVMSSTSIDKLDDISISGPKPEVHREASVGKGKGDVSQSKQRNNENNRHRNDSQKKKSQTPSSHRTTDPPVSLHDIADPVVAAALEKSLASKNKRQDPKAKVEKAQNGSGPSTPTSLSGSSRSGSYSSIVSESAGQGKPFLNPAPGGPAWQDSLLSPLGSGNVWNVGDNFRSFLPVSQHRRNSEDNSVGFSWRKLGSAQDAEENQAASGDKSANNNSMFFYDNLTSLRATKMPLKEDGEKWEKAPGTKVRGTEITPRMPFKSDLNPESSEFIPKPVRESLTLKNTRQKSGLGFESVRPPPGLGRVNYHGGMWSGDDLLLNSTASDRNGWSSGRYGMSDLLSSFNEKGSYSSLFGPHGDRSNLCHFEDSPVSYGSPVSERTGLWSGNAFKSQAKDISWSSSGIAPSIWSSAELTATKNSVSSSLSGLDLCLPPYSDGSKEDLSDENPVDRLEVLWPDSDAGIGIPYEGWSDDIREK